MSKPSVGLPISKFKNVFEMIDYGSILRRGFQELPLIVFYLICKNIRNYNMILFSYRNIQIFKKLSQKFDNKQWVMKTE